MEERIAQWKENRFHRSDFSIIAGTAAFSIFCYVYNLVDPRFHFLDTLWALVPIGIAGLLSLLVGVVIEKSSTAFADKIKRDEAQEDEEVMTVLKSKTWLLNYSKSGKGKEITFEDEDRIGSGLSDTLHSWRVKNGLLEILNNQGQIYSRFSFDRDKQVFDPRYDIDKIPIHSSEIISSATCARLADDDGLIFERTTSPLPRLGAHAPIDQLVAMIDHRLVTRSCSNVARANNAFVDKME